MEQQDVEVEKASTESTTVPDEKGQDVGKKSISEEGLESQELTEHSDKTVKSTGEVHREETQSTPEKDGQTTKIALQDFEVIGQDTVSKEVLFEVATLSVEEKEEKEQKNRRDSVTVDKPLTQVESAEVAEVEECMDLIAQAKEVENVEGEEVVVLEEERERKQSQVSLQSVIP